jgi:uncharacterized protein YbjT (DUF2867 family)
MDESPMRIVVLGASGNFGARIVRALSADPTIELIAASRTAGSEKLDAGVQFAALDIHAVDFARRLHALQPQLVIHCVGPFQAQDYHVAKAALVSGAHYLDLADGREFVANFAVQNRDAAQTADRLAIAGASTLPALSSAVIEALRQPLTAIEGIEIAIAPGQRAPRGTATLAAVFSYLGRPFLWKRDGKWQRAWGWQELKRIRFDFGTRWAAACDVPDLEVLPQHYPGVGAVSFRAALEVGLQQLSLWVLAALRRRGLSLPIERWAPAINRFASWFDIVGSDCGGMQVSVVGTDADGVRRKRTWHLTARGNHGPEIPCMASILLARQLARGQLRARGAFPCIGFLTLADFEREFDRWAIHTRVEDVAA